MRMEFITLAFSVAIAAAPGVFAQETVGQRIGDRVEKGVNQIGSELRQTWAEIRRTAERMGVEGRVYSRLHWDKAIAGATLDVEVPAQGTVVLKGSVPTAAAKTKAVQLAQDTIGVQRVVDELGIAVPATPAAK